MSTYTTSRGRRVVLFISGVAIGINLLSGVASAESTHAQAKGHSDASGFIAHSDAADSGKGKSNAPGQLAKSDAPAAQGLSDAPGAVAHSDANPVNLQPQPASNADFSGNGANVHGAYDSTRDGSPSGNGNGNGEAVGKPCAGCVGKADNKNPAGQKPNGSDHNAGYECDRNHGIGRTNPAHTGCTTTQPGGGDTDNGGQTPSDDDTPVVSGDETGNSNKPVCAGGEMITDVNHDGILNDADCGAVLGVELERAAPANVAPASVMEPVVVEGSSFTPGADALPRTGLDLSSSVLLAMVLLATGFVLVRKATPVRK